MKKSKLYVFGDSFTTTSGLSFMEYYYRLNKRPSELYIKEYDRENIEPPPAKDVAPYHWKSKVAENLDLELIYKGGDARANYDILKWYLEYTDNFTDDDTIVIALSDPCRFLVPNAVITNKKDNFMSDGVPRGTDIVESYHPHVFYGHGFNVDKKIEKAYAFLSDTVYLDNTKELNKWWYDFTRSITRLSKGKVFIFNSSIWTLFPSMNVETNGTINDHIHWGRRGNEMFIKVLTYCIENSITDLSRDNVRKVKQKLYGIGDFL